MEKPAAMPGHHFFFKAFEGLQCERPYKDLQRSRSSHELSEFRFGALGFGSGNSQDFPGEAGWECGHFEFPKIIMHVVVRIGNLLTFFGIFHDVGG